MHERRTICHLFLSSESVKPTEINLQMKIQYGDICLSVEQKVFKWPKFCLWLSSAMSGVPSSETRVESECIVMENRWVMDETVTVLNVSHGSAHQIIQFSSSQCIQRLNKTVLPHVLSSPYLQPLSLFLLNQHFQQNDSSYLWLYKQWRFWETYKFILRIGFNFNPQMLKFMLPTAECTSELVLL